MYVFLFVCFDCRDIFLTVPLLFQTSSEPQCLRATQSEESRTGHCWRKEEEDDAGYCKYFDGWLIVPFGIFFLEGGGEGEGAIS